MARQFKVEVVYQGGHTAELYWHDNDLVEFSTIPQTLGVDIISLRTALIDTVVAFMKGQKVNS
ncbi:MAG: hypothetical protein ABWY25_10135, partial [Paenisporosarcina sp.]